MAGVEHPPPGAGPTITVLRNDLQSSCGKLRILRERYASMPHSLTVSQERRGGEGGTPVVVRTGRMADILNRRAGTPLHFHCALMEGNSLQMCSGIVGRHLREGAGGVRASPPFANCAKDGAPPFGGWGKISKRRVRNPPPSWTTADSLPFAFDSARELSFQADHGAFPSHPAQLDL